MNRIDGKKTDPDYLKNYPTVNEALDLEYGKPGTASREKFTVQAHTFYTGQLIENARKDAHLSQDEPATRIGLNNSNISRIENGKTEPKVSTIYQIAAELGLSVDLNPLKNQNQS